MALSCRVVDQGNPSTPPFRTVTFTEAGEVEVAADDQVAVTAVGLDHVAHPIDE
jgi:hypothetical protein